MKEAMRTKNVLVMTLVIALFIGFVGQSKAQDGVWTSNGPYGGLIPALAVSPNYATDHTAYAGANDGRVYKTTDGGANWTAVSTGINTSELILALAISPNYSTDNTVFAGVNSRGVYKTTDDGENWTEVLSSSSAGDTRSLAISPNYATDQTIFAGTYAGVFKSTDGGSSWTAVNSGISSTSYMCYLAISPNYANDQTLYVGGRFSGGIYKSTDGGSSWTLVNSGMSVYSITISPNFSTDQTVYAGSSSGIYKTTDGGSSWTAVTTGIYGINSLATSPNYINDQTVYAGTDSGVYKTTDRGISWTAVNSGISDTPLNIRSLAISPDYMTDQTVFAGLRAGGVFKTTSGGSSWAANNTGISSASISSLVIHPGYANDKTIFAGSYDNGVYRTTDGGASWASINSGISNFNIYSLVISPDYEADSTVFAGSWGGGVYKTTDGGSNWAAVNTGITNNVISSLAISPNYAADRTVFAGLYYGRAVCKTTNGGTSWTPVLTVSSAVFSLAVSPNYASDFTVYAGTGSGVYKTTDGGASWAAVNSGITTGYGVISSLAVSPDYAADQTVYAGTTYRGVFKSTDGGASWAYLGISGTIHSIAVSPDYGTDQTVYVGTGSGGPHGGGPSRGIFKSTDGGANWTTMNSGLPTNLGSSSPTICISPDFAADQTVFAGTNGFSVFSYILSVNSPPVVSDIPDQTIDEGGSFATISLDNYVSDVDHTDAEMTWTYSGNMELTVSINANRVATIGIPDPDWSGSETITFTATDPGELSDSDAATFTVIPANTPPTANAGGPYSVDEGGSVPVNASGSDPEGDPLTFAWDLDNDGTFETPGQSVTFLAAGLDGPSSHTIAVQVTDDGGLSDTDQTTVEVLNVAPTAIFANISGAVNEGETTTLAFSNQFDPSAADAAASFWYSYDCTDDGTFEISDDSAASFVCHYPDNGTFTARGRIKDKDGGFTDYTVEVTVNNTAPTVGEIFAPLDPVQVNTEIGVSADFTDPGVLDTHTAVWDWGDGSQCNTATDPDCSVTESSGSGSATGNHTYTTPGVYTVKLTVTDKDGDSGESMFEFVVIYDPEGGFVTGGGWIWSEAGFCKLTTECEGAEGKANFGFVSKYKKGADVPTGETEFQFKAGSLNFHSDSYEWLVVAGHKAMYKGVGTINGAGNYGFMLSAIDEKLTPSTDVDLFRIKIWDKDDDDTIVYDNQMGAEDDADPTTAIGGGNIVIHK